MSLQQQLEQDDFITFADTGVSDCGRLFSIVLAIFGGMVMVGGLHRFYAGRYLSGFLMLCTLGGFFVWTLIDLGYLLAGSFLDSRGRPIRKWLVEDRD